MEVHNNASSLVYSIIPTVILASLYHITGLKPTNQTHSQPQQKNNSELGRPVHIISQLECSCENVPPISFGGLQLLECNINVVTNFKIQ